MERGRVMSWGVWYGCLRWYGWEGTPAYRSCGLVERHTIKCCEDGLYGQSVQALVINHPTTVHNLCTSPGFVGAVGEGRKDVGQLAAVSKDS